jgi:chitodextrinase
MRILGTLALAGSSGDTEAPTQPQNLIAIAINRQRIDLTWAASTDNIGVTGYQIFRGGNQLTTTTLTSYSDTTVTASTAYSYTVVAYDGAGNNSPASASAQATTPANASPSWQTIPDQTLIVGDSYALNLNDYCTDADADTVQYSIPTGTLPTGVTLVGASISGTPTTAGQISTVTVRAYDGFVNVDTTIDFSTFNTDVTAPPVPAGFSASAASVSQINLTWSASTDVQGGANEYVSGTQDYRIYRATDQATFSLRATTSSLSYSDTGLSASTRYDYKITARDTELNESAQSSVVNATTSTVGSASDIRFNPGHYGQLRTVAGVKTSEAVILADLAVISANSGEANIVGWAANFAWKQIEASQGVYDFTTPDRYFNACKAIGKRFIFRLDYRRYSGDGTQSVVPAYLYPAGQVAAADGGATPRDWEASVMDRIIACYQAIAAHYDADSMFQAVQGMVETSVSFDATYPAPANYTTTNKKTQYKRWMDAVRGPSGFQFAQVWFGQNYLGNQDGSDCEEMIIYAKALYIGVGGPDSWQIDWVVPPAQSGKRPLWSDEVARGVRGSGIDYRNGLAWPREAQGTEMGGYIGNMLPQDILQSCNFDGSQWMIWDYITAANTPGSTAATQWGNGSTQGTLWVIRNQPVTHTVNPYVPVEILPSQYVAGTLTWISWDAPTIAYPGIDLNYKMTGYDWHNRKLTWSIDSGPAWLSIGSTSGIFAGTPPTDSTNHSVTVRLTAGATSVAKTFTIQVSSAKCKFVATTGNDTTGTGAIGAPYLTIGKALQVAVAAGTGYLILVRSGAHAQNFASVNASLWGQAGTEANPIFCRAYPGEAPTLAVTGDGPSLFGTRIVWDRIPITGGTGSEGGCITVDGTSLQLGVVKRTSTSGYRASGSVNPTGVKFYAGAILDACVSFNNLDSGGTTPQNWSNFLGYCDGSAAESFLIDCIGHTSTCGSKIKHAGSGRIHLHRSVMYDVSNAADMADNWSTSRFCLLRANATAGNKSAVGFGNSSETGSDLGALVDGCLIIAENLMNGLSASPFYFYADNTQPAKVRGCTFVVRGTASTANNGENWAIAEYPYGAIPATQELHLTRNVIYSSDSTKVQYHNLNQLTLAQTNAKAGCSGNLHVGPIGTATLTFQAAGYKWTYSAAAGLVQGSAL